MADTARSLSAIKALLADNTTGGISPQDLRDTVETLTLTYGELYNSSGTATTISDTTSYFDIAGTWTLGQAAGFDENTNGQLRYTGTPDIEVVTIGVASLTSAGNNDIVHLRLENSGTVITSSDSTQKLATGADVATLVSIGMTSMSTNDYITMAVRNETATDDLTASNAHLIVVGFAI